MNGFDRLKEQVKDQEDSALKQVIEYLTSRDDMEQKYLNEEKMLKKCVVLSEKRAMHMQKTAGILLLMKLFSHGLLCIGHYLILF